MKHLPAKQKKPSAKELTPLSLLTLFLSFVSLMVVTTLLFLSRSDPLFKSLLAVDFLICIVFWIQLITDFFRSPKKLAYLKQHWVDFVASIPVIESLRFARLFQIIRLYRLLRKEQQILKIMKENRRESTVATILFLLVLLVMAGTGAIYFFEAGNPAANIQSSSDALWWVFVTISTVGYGDYFPVSFGGRAVAVVLMIAGVGLFGTISGLVTSFISTPEQTMKRQLVTENRDQMNQILAQQAAIMRRLDRIESRLPKENPSPDQES
ncbi:potassium channel family protein [Parasalinivibrio latis]|uniref:potassium channel family protein n=1 Tax=Parasalinivibrio latis TaxID=2952610 RepID=UPI0030E52A44